SRRIMRFRGSCVAVARRAARLCEPPLNVRRWLPCRGLRRNCFAPSELCLTTFRLLYTEYTFRISCLHAVESDGCCVQDGDIVRSGVRASAAPDLHRRLPERRAVA